MIEPVVHPFSLHSRIVKDLDFYVDYVLDHSIFVNSTLGVGYPLSSIRGLEVLMKSVHDRASDYYFHHAPASFTREEHLFGVILLGKTPSSCEISSPWVDVSRKITLKKNEVVIVDQLKIKKSSILNPELHSNAYIELQKKISDCFSPKILMLKSAR